MQKAAKAATLLQIHMPHFVSIGLSYHDKFWWKARSRLFPMKKPMRIGKPAQRESQIGAWASLQSQFLLNQDTLISRVAEYEQKYANKDVPRPEHWTGFRLAPGTN